MFPFLSVLFSVLWLNVFLGTRGRPRKLMFVYKPAEGQGHGVEQGSRGYFQGSPPRVLFSYIWRGHWEDREKVTADWPASWTWLIGGVLTLPMSLKCTLWPRFLGWEPFSRRQPWSNSVLLRLYGQHVCLNPLRASVKAFKILASRGGELLLATKTSLVSKFPCLWKLPPTILGWGNGGWHFFQGPVHEQTGGFSSPSSMATELHFIWMEGLMCECHPVLLIFQKHLP